MRGCEERRWPGQDFLTVTLLTVGG